MKFFTQILSVGLLLALCLCFCSATTRQNVSTTLPLPQTAAPQTSATSAVLFLPAANTFVVERNADERRPMASTTKIMTALVVLEHCALSETVIVAPEAVGVEGSSIYLYKNEEISVETLLYGLLLSSANDAAAALAIYVAGSIAAFADLMNEKAAALSLTDTHFTNPHGLYDENHYTTARELALITATALENETFAKIVATERYSAPQNGTDATRLFLNHNRLLRTYEGAVGVKTGFTKKSGRCLVSAAKRDGLLLIAVTLDDGNDWRDHQALLEFAFAEYTAFTPQLPSLTLPVVGGVCGTVSLTADPVSTKILPQAHGEIQYQIELPRFLYAGFAANERVGQLVVMLDGAVLDTIPLKTADGVARAKDERSFFQKIVDWFH